MRTIVLFTGYGMIPLGIGSIAVPIIIGRGTGPLIIGQGVLVAVMATNAVFRIIGPKKRLQAIDKYNEIIIQTEK